MGHRKKYRTAISVILSFFLTVCLFFIMFCAEIGTGYLGTRTFQDSLTESRYIENAINKMKAEMAQLLEDKRIPPEFAEEIDNNSCYIEVSNYVSAVLEGKQGYIDTTDLEETLRQYLNEYLETNQIYQTEGIRTTIDEVTDRAGELYRQYLQPGFVATFRQFGQQHRLPLEIMLISSAVIAVVIVVILLAFHHYKHRAVRYMAVSTASAVIWNLICAILLQSTDAISSLEAGPEYYLDFLKCYVKNGQDEWWMISALGVLIWIMLCAVVKYLKHNVK